MANCCSPATKGYALQFCICMSHRCALTTTKNPTSSTIRQPLNLIYRTNLDCSMAVVTSLLLLTNVRVMTLGGKLIPYPGRYFVYGRMMSSSSSSSVQIMFLSTSPIRTQCLIACLRPVSSFSLGLGATRTAATPVLLSARQRQQHDD